MAVTFLVKKNSGTSCSQKQLFFSFICLFRKYKSDITVINKRRLQNVWKKNARERARAGGEKLKIQFVGFAFHETEDFPVFLRCLTKLCNAIYVIWKTLTCDFKTWFCHHCCTWQHLVVKGLNNLGCTRYKVFKSVEYCKNLSHASNNCFVRATDWSFGEMPALLLKRGWRVVLVYIYLWPSYG